MVFQFSHFPRSLSFPYTFFFSYGGVIQAHFLPTPRFLQASDPHLTPDVLWDTLRTQHATSDIRHQTLHTFPGQTSTQYWYLDAVRALGGLAGQHISHPKVHRPLAGGLYDSERSEENPDLPLLPFGPEHRLG